jgi:uncharacterized protein YceK
MVAIIFLLTHSGCAGLNKNQVQTKTAYPESSVTDAISQKEKDEREWLLTVLIILGIAIALGATISASSGGDGKTAFGQFLNSLILPVTPFKVSIESSSSRSYPRFLNYLLL